MLATLVFQYWLICDFCSHLACRPEGGWEEPDELDMFMERGFQKVTLGTRVLRSDVAIVSLLALAHEVCSKTNND
jgi:RsmE family RNA methyltransferase